MSVIRAVTVQEEYNKNQNIKTEDVQTLMTWIDGQQYLPKITELEALIFLSGQHGDQDLTQKKIDVYYTSRTKLPEFFKDRGSIDSEHIEFALYGHLELPRQYDRTMYCRIMNTDPAKLNISEQVKLVGMVSDIWIIREGSAPGYQYVVDASVFQLGHLLKIKLNVLKNAIYILQETLPVNVSYVHVINIRPFVEKLFQMSKPFIKSYLLKKIIFHSHGIESLYQYVPKEYLPKEVGGDGPTIEELHNKMKATLTENASYFQDEQSKRIDETKKQK